MDDHTREADLPTLRLDTTSPGYQCHCHCRCQCSCSNCGCRDTRDRDTDIDRIIETFEIIELETVFCDIGTLPICPTTQGDDWQTFPMQDSGDEHMDDNELSFFLPPLLQDGRASPSIPDDGGYALVTAWRDVPHNGTYSWRDGNNPEGFAYPLESVTSRPCSPANSMYNNPDADTESMSSSVVSSRMAWSGTASFYTKHAGGNFPGVE